MNKSRAEELAEKVRGVRRVTNLLRVESALRGDQEIAADVRARLSRDVFLGPCPFDVVAEFAAAIGVLVWVLAFGGS
jgi:hypothetical protein